MMNIKCYNCGYFKNKDEFYRNNLSKCKECKKSETRNSKISKNDVFNILNEIYNRINSNEFFIKEIHSSLKKLEKKIELNNINNKLDDIENTINNISNKNKNINGHIETIINCKNKVIFDDKYEKELKDMLGSDYEDN